MDLLDLYHVLAFFCVRAAPFRHKATSTSLGGHTDLPTALHHLLQFVYPAMTPMYMRVDESLLDLINATHKPDESSPDSDLRSFPTSVYGIPNFSPTPEDSLPSPTGHLLSLPLQT